MLLKDKLKAGQFAVLAEMEPPKGVDVDKFVANAIRVKDQVDAFIVPEMNSAVMRMSSLGGCLVLQNKGLSTVMQVNCRDRNRLALQADLLAGAACGVANIMAVTGEDPSFGDHHEAAAVHDIDLIGLLSAVTDLCKGRDMAGVELAGAPSFLAGSTVNAGVRGKALDLELEEMERKMEAGARFFVTPPVFDMPEMDSFLKRANSVGAKIFPTILLLKSVGMARYIDRHSDHVRISQDMIKRITKAPDKARECVKIAAETIATAKKIGLDGVVVSTLGWEHKLFDVLSIRASQQEKIKTNGQDSTWGKHAGGN